ncbi:MFS transporter [Catellatospora tritici]|uniref:MFS transporter n=1 Tax=Catellatospora tritici TaxID=2851566 RepID=UPI001C2DAE1F|nr:MFS transporter [Catellatospora tritici]MBV1853718.1 MFS transporter [Catellatospora tritici]
MTAGTAAGAIRTAIPARLDRLRWSPFHTRMIVGLGAAWILDGLNITVASSVSAILQQPDTLGLSSTQVGLIATVYLVGEIVGALVFGKMSDRLGRKRLFVVTLGVFLVGSGLSAFTFGNSTGWIIYFYATRFIAGMGIGGEYSAINSAIDEMMPSRYRGRVDVWVNGTYWAGSILGTFVSLIFLNAMNPALGWRLAFLVGPLLAVVVILVRRNLPESPRWLVTHGFAAEAEQAIKRIEREVTDSGQLLSAVDPRDTMTLKPEKQYGYLTFLRLVFRQYTKRAILAASLMITQSFLYNAIFFTYAIVLTQFYGVSATKVPIYGLAFAVGNLAGPLLLGHLFDKWGRKTMIAGTYMISAVLLAVSAWLFDAGALTAETQTLMWIAIFFLASAGASAAYLTASEIFPIEIRAEAIAVFFAIAQVAGAIGPLFYGALIGDGSNRGALAVGYLIGAVIMFLGGLVEVFFGVNAEGKSLETVAPPLTAVEAEG